ncbi:MAG: CDP-diacylglycerol--serine O-phosphatidyltransferase [Dissulfurimicrobium sp.]
MVTRQQIENPVKNPRRGAYLLPNLITSAALFSGFYAIISAINGNYQGSAVAIFVAAIFDGLDGRIARLTKTTSRFGIEYDSLSDLVAFGVAPAVLGFVWGLREYGRLGWLAAFIYAATTALRLARFNTLSFSGMGSKRYFVGLPCPSAACTVASLVLLCQYLGMAGPIRHVGVLAIVYILSFLMVSNVRYYSFKEMRWFHRHPFSGIIVVLMAMTVVAIEPKVTLFVVMSVYVLSGPVLAPFKRFLRVGGVHGDDAEPLIAGERK